jgi:hypothetical protein
VITESDRASWVAYYEALRERTEDLLACTHPLDAASLRVIHDHLNSIALRLARVRQLPIDTAGQLP